METAKVEQGGELEPGLFGRPSPPSPVHSLFTVALLQLTKTSSLDTLPLVCVHACVYSQEKCFHNIRETREGRGGKKPDETDCKFEGRKELCLADMEERQVALRMSV